MGDRRRPGEGSCLRGPCRSCLFPVHVASCTGRCGAGAVTGGLRPIGSVAMPVRARCPTARVPPNRPLSVLELPTNVLTACAGQRPPCRGSPPHRPGSANTPRLCRRSGSFIGGPTPAAVPHAGRTTARNAWSAGQSPPPPESVQEKLEAVHDLATEDAVAEAVATDSLRRRPAVSNKAVAEDDPDYRLTA